MASPPSTTFSSLNTDVQNYLAEFLDNASLLNMRQVSRDTSRNVESQFIKVFFTEREHLVTVHSLKALAELTALPRLTSRLRELRFVPATTGKHASGPFPISLHVNFTRTTPDETPDLQDLMSTVFHNLASQRRFPALKIMKGKDVQNWRVSKASFGYAELQRRAPDELLVIGEEEQILTMLLTTVARSSFEMHHLDVFFLTETAMTSGIAPVATTIYPALSNLRSLDLVLEDGTFIEEECGLPEFLAAASNVTELAMESISPELFNKSFRHHRIESLTLRDIEAESGEFIDMLKQHQDTLKKLRLQKLLIEEVTDSWSVVFGYLVEHCALEELDLRELSRGDRFKADDGDFQQVYFEEARQLSCVGCDNIHKHLRTMLDTGVQYRTASYDYSAQKWWASLAARWA